MTTKEHALGLAAAIGYILLTSLSAVWVHASFAKINGELLTFCTFAAATLLFCALAAGRLKSLIGIIRAEPLTVIQLNISTLFSWWLMFLALQKIPASVEAAIYMGWIPLTALAFNFADRTAKLASLRSLGAFLVTLSIGILAVSKLNRETSLLQGAWTQNALGIALASVAGIAGGIYVIVSGRFHKRTNCQVLDVLCLRFWLLLLVTGYLAAPMFSQLIIANAALALQLVVLALTTVIFPVFCLQLAIARLGGQRTALLMPAVPVVALLTELAIRMPMTWPVVASTLALSASLLLANIWLRR